MNSLGQQAARGAAWTISTSLGSRMVGLAATLILTRYISPAEYGAVSVATVLVFTTSALSSFGLAQFLIVRPQLSSSEAFHVSLFHLFGVSVALCVLAFLKAMLAPVFETPALVTFLPGMCIAIFLERVACLPERLLSRRLQFRRIAISRAVGEMSYALAAVALSTVGFGGMAIVYGNIIRYGVHLSIMLRSVERKAWLSPSPVQWSKVKEVFRFGMPLSIATLTQFASKHWDNLLMARFFGPRIVGLYNLSYNLADIPAAHVGEHIGDVLLPSFAQMPAEQRRAALLKATGFLAILVFPLAVGLAALGPSIATTIFDPRWSMMGSMLALLAGLSVVRPVGWTMMSYLQALSSTNPVMILGVLRLFVLLSTLWALAHLGPLWACAAAGLAYGVHALGAIAAVRRLDGIMFRSVFAHIIPSLLACVPMVAAVLGTRKAMHGSGRIGHVDNLIAEIVVGMISFTVAAWFIAPRTSREFLAAIRKILTKSSHQSETTPKDNT